MRGQQAVNAYKVLQDSQCHGKSLGSVGFDRCRTYGHSAFPIPTSCSLLRVLPVLPWKELLLVWVVRVIGSMCDLQTKRKKVLVFAVMAGLVPK